MPRVGALLHSRRRRRGRGERRARLRIIGLTLAGPVFVALGLAAMLGAAALGDLRQGLPSIRQVESLFDPASGGAPRSSLWLDSSGSQLLYEAASPAATERRGLSLDPLSPDAAPPELAQAVISYLDPGFWDHPGYEPAWLWQVALAALRGQAIPAGQTITLRLVRATLAPPRDAGLPPLARALREALLAAELTRGYGRQTILTWYLNSAYFGNEAYGADAAALVYFGRHASGLDLGECALLAGLAAEPEADPFHAPQRSKALQAEVLEALVADGAIPIETAQTALASPLRLAPAPQAPALRAEAFSAAAMQQAAERFGSDFLHRIGLRILTSVDLDLQQQLECVVRTQLARLAGGQPGATEPAADGTPCLAAGLLPPLRPGQAGRDHTVGQGAAIVLDPETGIVLARVLVGEADAETGMVLAAGPVLYPFIYLAGFARGATPGTMLLDIPTVFAADGGGLGYAPADDDGQFHGPVRPRTALAGLFPVSAARMAAQVGVNEVLRTSRQMGLATLPEPSAEVDLEDLLEGSRVDLTDLASALGVIARGGMMAGVEAGDGGPEPVLILRITNDGGDDVYTYTPDTRAVLSGPLAYLMVDLLSDEPARWPTLGQPNLLEVGRPAGALSGLTLDGAGAWAVGFTPSRVLAVWLGNESGEPMAGVTPASGPAAIWQAGLRYATRDLPAQGWSMPSGVSRIEVCDPSGLLPTAYCPETVSEVFLAGTEPIYSDSLYRPLQVNRETGKLATLFTPLDLIEERVYQILPLEAQAWADQSGLERPPTEYDTLYQPAFDPLVNLTTPPPFAMVRGQVVVRGNARPDRFSYYRLQAGEGLNPSSWVQIGEDQRRPVRDGRLGTWDTQGLDGLYTLQLLVILEEGRIATAAVQVTVDNEPPTVRLVLPTEGQVYGRSEDETAILQAEAGDNLGLAQVVFTIDNVLAGEVNEAPYSLRWPLGRIGEHTVVARAVDRAGNTAESEVLSFTVVR